MTDARPNPCPSNPIRWAVCIAFAGWAMWAAITGCLDALSTAADSKPTLAEVMVQRFEPARDALADTRSVRYVQHEKNYTPNTAEARRAIASYALVPVLVTDNPDERLILADFADDPALARYMKANPVTLLKHLGPGLGLLEVDRP
jgi:hypothetical protein